MDLDKKQIAPPKLWEDFESFCLVLFREVWSDLYALKNGRRGQPQCGVDVYRSFKLGEVDMEGVQCKGKEHGYGAKLKYREILDEIQNVDLQRNLTHFTA